MSCAVKLSEIMKLTHFKLYFMSNAYQYKLEEYELSITRGLTPVFPIFICSQTAPIQLLELELAGLILK